MAWLVWCTGLKDQYITSRQPLYNWLVILCCHKDIYCGDSMLIIVTYFSVLFWAVELFIVHYSPQLAMPCHGFLIHVSNVILNCVQAGVGSYFCSLLHVHQSLNNSMTDVHVDWLFSIFWHSQPVTFCEGQLRQIRGALVSVWFTCINGSSLQYQLLCLCSYS